MKTMVPENLLTSSRLAMASASEGVWPTFSVACRQLGADPERGGGAAAAAGHPTQPSQPPAAEWGACGVVGCTTHPHPSRPSPLGGSPATAGNVQAATEAAGADEPFVLAHLFKGLPSHLGADAHLVRRDTSMRARVVGHDAIC